MSISYNEELHQNFEDLVEGQLDDIAEQKAEGIFAAPPLPGPLSMTMPPVVTNLTTSVNVMSDDDILDRSDIGTGTFTITIDFDQAMNTTVLPAISFPTLGEDPGALFTFTGFAWSNGNQTYTLTFTVNDLEFEIPDVDIQVSGAQSSSGDVMTSVIIADVFSIDMDADAGDDLAVSFNDGNGFIDSSEDLSAVEFMVSGLDGDSTAVVTFTGTDAMGMTITQTANVAADGTSSVDLTGFAAGPVTATIASTDNAGNTAAGTGDSSVIDSSADADGNLSLTISDTAVNAADGNILSFDVAGLDGDLTSAMVTFSDGMNMIMVDVSAGDGTYNVDLTTLNDATITSVLGVTDAAGNTASDNGADIDLDRTADAGIGLFISIPDTNIDLSESTMVSFSISDLDADLVSAIVTFTDGVDSVTVNVLGGDGPYSVDLSSLADGTITSSIAVTDDAGNTAGANGPDITMDTDVPDAPVITSISTDSGANTSDGITNDNEVTIFGTAEANAYVEVFSNGMSIGTVQANGMGDWSINYPDTVPDGADKDDGPLFLPAGLADGTYSLTAVTTDAVGNSSPASAAFTLEIDTDDPNAPVISSTITNDAGGTDSDGSTTDATPTLSITAEAGSAVEVFIDGASAGFAVETATAGTFTFTSAVLTTGPHDFTATSTDTAGNTSPTSMTMTLSISEFAEITSITDDANMATMDGLNDGTGTVVDGDAPDTATTSGTITFEDFAAGQSHSVTAILPPPGALGNFSVSLLNAATDDGLGAVGWSFSVPNADIDYLDAGDTITQDYIVRITDGDGNETDQAITIIILGTDDAAVITADETGAVAEGNIGDPAVTATGSIAVTDADDDDNPSFANAAAMGTYGSLVVNAAGDGWTYTLDQSLVQEMDAGDMVDDVITLTDDEGNSIDITITITGTDDAAIITGDTTESVTEGDIGDAPVVVTGAIGVTDIDADDNPSFANVGVIGLYGTLTVNPAGDEWSYTLNQAAAQDLDDGDIVNDVITLTDDEGNTRDITIEVTGTADAAVITADVTGSVNEGDIGDTVTATGAIAVTDADADDTPSFENATFTGTYGTITVNAAGDQWTYTLDQTSVQDLDDGDMVMDNLTLTDDEGNTVDIDIAITGTNDEPVITTPMGGNEGAVTEDTPMPEASSAIGQITADDADDSAVLTFSGDATGTYGAFVINAMTGEWTYNLDDLDPDTDALTEGQIVTETFTVTVTDDQMATTTQDVTITITGSNDGPVATDETLADLNEGDSTVVTLGGLSLAIADLATDVDSTLGSESFDFTDVTIDGVSTTLALAGISYDPMTGELTIDADVAAYNGLAIGDSAEIILTFEVTDDFMATDTGTISFNIDGTNDGPVITTPMGGNEGAVTENAPVVADLTPIPLGMDIQVNTTTTDAQLYSTVAALNDGGFVVTWSSFNQDAGVSDYGIYGQRYDAMGIAVGTEFQVNTETAGDQIYSSVTALNDGGFVVTWSSFGQDSSAWGIYGQRYDAMGAVVGTEFQVNTETTDDQVFSNVTALDDGGFLVTWETDGQDGSNRGIYGQRYDDMGAVVGAEFQINTETAEHQRFADVAILDDGGFVVTWSSNNQDGNGWGVYGQRYDDMGAVVGTEFQINTETAGSQLFSSVTGLTDGGFVVTWESGGQDGSSTGIYGQRYDAMGFVVGTEFLVNTETVDTQIRPDVTALDDGGFVVTWSSVNQDGDSWGIYGQRYDDMGVAIGSEFRISDITTGAQFSDGSTGLTTIDTLADGRLVVTWTGQGTEEVFTRIIDVPDAGPTTNSTTGQITADDVDAGAVLSFSGDAVGTYGAFVIDAMTGEWTFTLDEMDTDTDALTEGQIVTETFTVTVTDDQHATTSQDVTITITGTNDGPVATDETLADLNEGDSTVVTLGGMTLAIADLATDVDSTLDSESFDFTDVTIDGVSTTLALAGISYDPMTGELTIDADVAAYNGLAIGDSAEIILTFEVTDDFMATDTGTITFNVNGTNDGPVITTPMGGNEGAVTEDTPMPEASSAMGQITADDADTGAVLTFSGDATGTYGAFVINAMTGEWTYNLDDLDADTDALTEGQIVTETFTVTVTDDQMATTTQDVTITITGTNDGPVATDETLADLNEGDSTVVTLGGLSLAIADLATDVDSTLDSESFDFTDVTIDGVSTTLALAGISYDPMTGELTIDADVAAYNGLAIGDSAEIILTFEVTDDFMATDSGTITFNIDGTNDGPVITTPMGENEGAVNEDDSGFTPIPTGMDILVNTTTTNRQFEPSIAALADGGFVVTFTDLSGADGDRAGIFGQRYDAMGTAIGGEFQINTTTSSFQTGSSVTALADGGFVVVFGDGSGADGDSSGVLGQRYDAMGVAVGTEFVINTTTTGAQFELSLTTLTDGGFVATFTDIAGADGNRAGVFGQRYDAMGAAVGAEFQVNTTTTSDQNDSSVTALADGGFVVTFTDSSGADGGGTGVLAQRYDAMGVAVGTEFLVNTTTVGGQNESNVTALADGGFVVTFTDSDGVSLNVLGQRFDAMGIAVGTEFLVNTTTTGVQADSNISALADGGFVVTFTDHSGEDGDGLGIFGQRYDAMGDAIGTEFLISDTTTGSQHVPSIVELADGRLAITFIGNETGANEDVFVRLIDVPDASGPITNSATGQITADDVDAGAVLTFSGDAIGTYGAFVIDAMTGEWTFTLDEIDPDTDALTEGQIVTETFTVTVTDDQHATTSQDVTITITGTNDAATISASIMEDTDVTEAGGDIPMGTPGDPDAGGTLSVSDVDTGEDVFEAPLAEDLIGDYGTFTFDDLTGAWTYVLDNANTDVQALEDGDMLTDTLTVSSLDGTDSYDIDVTINGTDDAATIEPGSTLAAQVDERADGAVDENTGTINTTGTIIFDDAEVSDTHNVTFTPITGPGTVGSIVDYIGTFSSNFTQAATGTDAGMITWNFDVNAADLDYLDEGETLVQLYQYSITGDDGAVTTQVVTITIVGVEDLSDVSGVVTGTVTEGNVGDAAVTATGTLTLSDPDLLDAGTPATFADVAATTGDNGYGTFEMTAGTWTFTLDQAAVQGFSTGEVFQDTFTFTASDGTAQLITVDINGADDVFVGTPNVDNITGTEGVDTITGLESDDIINALDGDDLIEGGAGADTIDGGLGSDTASYATSNSGVTINLLAGSASGGHAAGDILTNIENILGSAFNDALTGSSDDNTLDGGDGNDSFWGGEGSNTLLGGNGADQFFGGAGADFMDGGAGFDTVDYRASLAGITADLDTGGTAGDAAGDTYAGIERFYGTDFNDTINGSDGNEFLYGEDGNDTINGGGGIDRIFGGDGDDIQRGEAGNDTLYGSAGADQLNGGVGNDNANYSLATSAVELNMATGGTVGDAAGDTYFGIEVIFGSSFNDVITGNAATNDLRGGAGDDVLNGGDGNDRLHGGAGADILNGGNGIDSAQYTTASAGVIVDLVSGGTAGEAAGDSYSSIEWVFGSNFDDSITGDTGNNNLHGNDGADTLNGDGGNDRLFGGDGDDIINGGDGIDTIYGQDGNDTLSGGLGNDFFFGSDGGDSFDGGDDFDTVSYLASSSGIAVNMQTGSTGGDAAGDSYVSIERLLATNFNDVVIGSDGNDVLQGLGGDDILGGGQGADSLSGGAGIDQFLYNTTTSGADVILDFLGGSRGDETISLTNFDTDFDTFAEVFAAASQVGNNVIIDFGGGNTLTLTNYSLTYLDSTAFEFASVPFAEPFEEVEAGQDVDIFAADVLI